MFLGKGRTVWSPQQKADIEKQRSGGSFELMRSCKALMLAAWKKWERGAPICVSFSSAFFLRAQPRVENLIIEIQNVLVVSEMISKGTEEKELSDFALLTANTSSIVSRVFQINVFRGIPQGYHCIETL